MVSFWRSRDQSSLIASFCNLATRFVSKISSRAESLACVEISKCFFENFALGANGEFSF